MWRRSNKANTTSTTSSEGSAQQLPIEEQVAQAEQEWLDHWRRGPSRTRWTKLPPQVGEPAPNLVLLDMTGKPIHLRDCWRERPALLLFWRHYGCSCGVERAERLREEYADFVAAGANVVIIGQGEPERAAAYAQKHDLPNCPLLCDPGLRAYQAYGLLHATPMQILYDAPEAFWACDYEAGVSLQQARHAEGRPAVDDPWQLPGEFVVRPDGRLALAYRYQYCANFPAAQLLVSTIRQVVNAS
jgi:peroxiredoxin